MPQQWRHSQVVVEVAFFLFCFVLDPHRPAYPNGWAGRCGPKTKTKIIDPKYPYYAQRKNISPSTSDLTCARPTYTTVFGGIGFRTWSPPVSRPRPLNPVKNI
ncbi:hypothetical protein AVEN_184464-1 [Araneus ventricosus]|uniref:Secreted protein n=1 Tax=Araneus ventricosus TaxID=182803 RepID=A0A4Y2BH84_ARAVE|nr:hypothetical protein AVEN_184464-1 [Araneus ventricosus]